MFNESRFLGPPSIQLYVLRPLNWNMPVWSYCDSVMIYYGIRTIINTNSRWNFEHYIIVSYSKGIEKCKCLSEENCHRIHLGWNRWSVGSLLDPLTVTKIIFSVYAYASVLINRFIINWRRQRIAARISKLGARSIERDYWTKDILKAKATKWAKVPWRQPRCHVIFLRENFCFKITSPENLVYVLLHISVEFRSVVANW